MNWRSEREKLYKQLSSHKKRLLRIREQKVVAIEQAEIKTERKHTPKGRFHHWLARIALESDKILNRKLWRDYHK